MAILCISATPFETKPLLDRLQNLERLDFPLGQLFRGKLEQQSLYLAHLGIGKVNTAAGLALAITRLEPSSVIQIGIGGAFVGAFLSIGMVAVASRDIHLDSGLQFSQSWQDMQALGFPLMSKDKDYFNAFPSSEGLSSKFIALGAYPVAFGTSEAVSADFEHAEVMQKRFDVSVESMEGAAAAQVCLAFERPFAEIRGISNIVGERDKSAWDINKAIRNVNELVIKALSHC